MSGSVLCESTDLAGLLTALADRLQRPGRDPLGPVRVVVPNASLRRWLQIELARRLGISMGLRFEFLEGALWSLLTDLDPAAERPRQLTAESLHWMVLGQLLALAEAPSAPPAVAPLLGYLGSPSAGRGPFERRLWQLSGRLARCFRDYEFHRTEMIAEWLFQPARPGAGAMERAQRELFRLLFAEGGLRDRLTADGPREKTLEHYGADVLDRLRALPALPGAVPELHVVGLSTISRFHARALRELGRLVPVYVYACVPAAPVVLDEEETALGRLIGRCGTPIWQGASLLAESLAGARDEAPPFAREVAPAPAPATGDLLAALQGRIRGEPAGDRLPADGSVRVLAAPSPVREIEAVRDHALELLEGDPGLRWTDIAVLVADPEAYGPVLRAVFGADPRATPHVLSGFALAGADPVSSGALRLLDLALGRFSRAEVFELLLNPCCLAATGATADEVLTWREWATELGAYYSFAAGDRREQGYAEGSLHTWEQALRRLRWGQIIEPERPEADPAESGFAGVRPFTDLASADRGSVSRFTEVVEGLALATRRLRRPALRPAAAWAELLRDTFDRFLAAPPDEPSLEASLADLHGLLARLGSLSLGAGPAEVGLGLLREVLAEGLGSGAGRTGNVLLGGLSVFPLAAPLRPLPARVVFVVGLGEAAFPGREEPDALDLRRASPQPGDLSLPETHAALFLEALSAARERLVLSYVDRDLQKDRELRPSPLLADLIAAVRADLLRPEAAEELVARVPLHASDARYLEEGAPRSYAFVDRLVALTDPATRARYRLRPEQERRLQETEARRWAGLGLTAPEAPPIPPHPKARVHELAAFLENPIEAGLRRHLRIYPEAALPSPRDELEPAYSANWSATDFRREALADFVRRAGGAAGLPVARHELRGRARALYGARQLGSVAAAGRLGEADFEEHYAVIEEAAGAIERLLEGIEGGRLHEVVAVGPTRDTRRAVLRLPAVHLPVETADGIVEVELSGEGGLVWECPDRLAMLCLTGRSRAPSVRRKLADGTSVAVLDRALLEPYLLLALGAVAEDPATRAFFEGRPLTVHLLCGATAVSWQLGPPPPIRARRHLTGLVADFLGLDEAGSAWRDLLPFRPITEVDSLAGALYAEEVDDALHAAYTPLLVEAIDEASEGLHPLWSPRGGLRLLDDLAGLAPADALRKVRRRLRPILGSLEAGEARA